MDLMEQPPTNPQEILEGFDARPGAAAVIGRIILQGPGMAILTDWDGALTRKHTDGIGGTSWEILRRHMPDDDARERHRAYRLAYQPLELAGTLTADKSQRWQLLALSEMRGASVQAIKDDAASHIRLRDGVLEFFDTCQRYGYPVSVRSAGCAETIEAVAARDGLAISQVVSNRFLTAGDGDTITGIDPESFTHSLNKNRIPRHRDAGQRPYRSHLVIGDSPHDARMVDSRPSYTTFRTRMDGGKELHEATYGPGSWQSYVEQSFLHNYDAVVQNDSLFALGGLVRYIGEAQRQAA